MDFAKIKQDNKIKKIILIMTQIKKQDKFQVTY